MEMQVDLAVLLIGKTGHGKSSTGNTILGWKAFKNSSSASSETKRLSYEYASVDERIIQVVDAPGVCDTDVDTVQGKEELIAVFKDVIAVSPMGYHALILVFRFGAKFTDEERKTIEFLKAVFGENFVRKHCIIAISFGDQNEREMQEENGPSFKEWCDQQQGHFKETLQECNNRVVMFNNVTKDKKKQKSQMTELLTLIDSLKTAGRRYTNELFQLAEEARKRHMVEEKREGLTAEVSIKVSLILQELSDIRSVEDPMDYADRMQLLLTKCESLYEYMLAQDSGTGALHELLQMVKEMTHTVSTEIEISSRVAEKASLMEREHTRERQATFAMMNQFMELQQRYNDIKDRNDDGFFQLVGKALDKPIKGICNWFSGKK